MTPQKLQAFLQRELAPPQRDVQPTQASGASSSWWAGTSSQVDEAAGGGADNEASAPHLYVTILAHGNVTARRPCTGKLQHKAQA